LRRADKSLILAEGVTCFDTLLLSATNALRQTNPADFALDIVSVDLREERNEAVSREKVENLIRQFAESQQSEKLTARSEAKLKSWDWQVWKGEI
jgi:Lon protease-like protein